MAGSTAFIPTTWERPLRKSTRLLRNAALLKSPIASAATMANTAGFWTMACPYIDTENIFQGYISSAVDITERRLIEEEWQRQQAQVKAEENFLKTLEKVNLLGFTIERDGTISFCNDFMLKMTGWTREEVVGKDFFKMFVPGRRRRAPPPGVS